MHSTGLCHLSAVCIVFPRAIFGLARPIRSNARFPSLVARLLSRNASSVDSAVAEDGPAAIPLLHSLIEAGYACLVSQLSLELQEER